MHFWPIVSTWLKILNVNFSVILNLTTKKVKFHNKYSDVSVVKNLYCFWNFSDLRINCKEFLLQSMNAANCLKYRALGQRYNLSDICEATDRVITENFADILQHESFNELDISAMRAVLDARPNAVRFIFIRIGQLFCLICKK